MESPVAGVEPLPARWRRWAWENRLELVLALVFLGVAVQYTGKAMEDRSAVLRWRKQLQDMDEGENIYRTHVHPNPPITALMLKPLSELPPLVGALTWFFLKVAMAYLVIHWVCAMVESPERPFPLWAKALAVLLSIRPIIGDLTHGNINLYVLFLVVAALYAFQHGRDQLSGLTLSLAIATKVTPLLFVPYFLYKRAWKTLLACAVGLVLFIWVIPGLCLGWQENAVLLASWRKQMIDPFLFGGKVAYSDHHNLSLPGVVARLFTESPSFTFWSGPRVHEYWYHNLLSLHPRLADWLIVKPAMLLFAGLVVWSCRTPTQRRQSWRLAAEFSLVALGMLIFSERTWKHHCVLLIMPFTVLAYYLAACRPGVLLRSYLIATLAGALFFMSLTSTTLMNWEFAKLAQVYGAYLWAVVLLAAGMVVVLRQPAAGPSSVETPPAEGLATLEWPGLRVGKPLTM